MADLREEKMHGWILMTQIPSAGALNLPVPLARIMAWWVPGNAARVEAVLLRQVHNLKVTADLRRLLEYPSFAGFLTKCLEYFSISPALQFQTDLSNYLNIMKITDVRRNSFGCDQERP
ncbi:MAG: hypothetical protein HKN76_06630 [Saprospiraceae bacterium]|nr:hypothetical protein [Saprospiraceae bacterium]